MEKELNIPLDREIIPHIDSLEQLDSPDEVAEFAHKHKLDPKRLQLYKDIF